MLENQARCRAMSERTAILIRYFSLGSADPAAARNYLAFGTYATGLRRDRADKRNLELKCCLRKPPIEHRQNGKAHAAVEQRRSKAAVNSTKRIAVFRIGFCGNTTRPLEASTMS